MHQTFFFILWALELALVYLFDYMYIHRGQIYTNFVKCIDTTNKFLFSSFNSLNLKDTLHAYDKEKIIILMMKKSFKAESRRRLFFK